MKINYFKAYEALSCGDKLPRKVKKHFLGKRISKAKLNRLLKSVEIIHSPRNLYDDYIVKPYLFCPHCGCSEMRGTGNMTTYPEHWENFYCSRCKKLVGVIDNSPFIHAFEWAGNGYEPAF